MSNRSHPHAPRQLRVARLLSADALTAGLLPDGAVASETLADALGRDSEVNLHDFAAMGAPGFAVNGAIVHGWDAINSSTGAGQPNCTEYDLTLDYRFSSKTWPAWPSSSGSAAMRPTWT